MFWKEIGKFFKSLWKKLDFFRVSAKPNTALDTAKVSLFGLEIEVTREVSVDIPYELTVVIPRAELSHNPNSKNSAESSTEIILNSITIAHSPRAEGERTRTGSPLPPTLTNTGPSARTAPAKKAA